MKIQKRISHVISDSVKNLFSNHVVVEGQDGDVVVLNFFDVQKPFLLGSEEENQATVEALNAVPGVCIARVTMSTKRARSLVKAINTVLGAGCRSGGHGDALHGADRSETRPLHEESVCHGEVK